MEKPATEGGDKQGWLKKQRHIKGFAQGWKNRWFVLRGKDLSYYKSETDAVKKGSCVVLGLNEAFTDKKEPFVFQLLVSEGDGSSMKKKKYNLSAPTKTERDQWLDACHVMSKGVAGHVSVKDIEAITAFLADADDDDDDESEVSSPISRGDSSASFSTSASPKAFITKPKRDSVVSIEEDES